MRTTAVAALAAQLVIAWSGPVRADEKPGRFELTPLAGYRFGGSFEQENDDEDLELADGNARGLLLDIDASANTQWEVLYARQRTALDTPGPLAGQPPPPSPLPSSPPTVDIRIEHLHFGGTYLFEGRRTRPFIALTAGLARFEPGLEGADGETYFSGSLAGGVQLRPDKRIGVRLEARVLANLVDSDSDLFCFTSAVTNACAISVDGSVLVQWEARAGLVFRF